MQNGIPQAFCTDRIPCQTHEMVHDDIDFTTRVFSVICTKKSAEFRRFSANIPEYLYTYLYIYIYTALVHFEILNKRKANPDRRRKYIHICMYIYIHIYLLVCVYTNIYTCICKHIHMYIRSEREEENKTAREREEKRKCQLESKREKDEKFENHRE